MKRIFTKVCMLFIVAAQSQNFTPGNIVVSRVGDGTTTLSGNTAAMSLLEFAPTGTNLSPVKTVSINSTGTSKITTGGGTGGTGEGLLNLSADGRYLCFAGYDLLANDATFCVSTIGAKLNGIRTIGVGNPGTGYTSAPTVTIVAGTLGTGIGAIATATVSAGAVTAITVSISGAYYSSTPAPVITFTGGGGTGATAGTITYSTVGSGYTSGPTVSISGGGGTAATAGAQVTGMVTSIAVTNGGSGYASAPTVTFSGGGGSGAAATAYLVANAITSINITNVGSGYTSAPTISIGGGGGAAATATYVSGLSNIYMNTNGSAYTSNPTVLLSGGGGTVQAIPGVAVATVASVQGSNVKKVIGRVDYVGNVDYTTSFFSSASASPAPVKMVASADGSSFYPSYNATGYIPFASTTVIAINAAAATGMHIYNGKLYTTTSYTPIYFYNTASLPTTVGTAVQTTLLAASNGYQSAVFFDLNPSVSFQGTGYDVMYLADRAYGLAKYYWNGAIWTSVNFGNTPASTACINPTGSLASIIGTLNSAGQPVIYGIVGSNTTGASSKLCSITDASAYNVSMSSPTNTTIAYLTSAGNNYAFRGLAFSPSTNYTWTGYSNSSNNTDWITSQNWQSNVSPTVSPALDITIPLSTNYPVLASGTTVTVATGKTLTVNAGAAISVSLGGTLTNSGSIVVKPTAALINNGTSTISNVTIQQSVVGQRGYRMFSNPFTTSLSQSTLSSTNAITVTGTNDARIYTNATDSWASAGGAIGGNSMYALFIRGLASEVTGLTYTGGPTAFTYNASGTLNGNSITITPSATGYTLVGNPFAAPVKTQALTAGSAAPYYTYQIAVTGTPQVKAGTWVAASSNSSATTTIPVMGALAFQSGSATTYNVASTDINRSGTLQTGLFGETAPTQQLELVLNKGADLQDKLFVRIDKHSTATGNERMDLGKITNDVTNIYTIADNNTYQAVDARQALDKTVPLGITAPVGTYSFMVSRNNLPNADYVYLKDKFLQKEILLKEGSIYDFDITSDTTTKGNNRFEITVLQKLASVVTVDATFKATVLGNIVKNMITIQVVGTNNPITISVKDLQGKVITNVNGTVGTNRVSIANCAIGMYIVSVTDGTNTVIEKVVKP